MERLGISGALLLFFLTRGVGEGILGGEIIFGIKTKRDAYFHRFFCVRTHYRELPQCRFVADEGGNGSWRAEPLSIVSRDDSLV